MTETHLQRMTEIMRRTDDNDLVSTLAESIEQAQKLATAIDSLDQVESALSEIAMDTDADADYWQRAQTERLQEMLKLSLSVRQDWIEASRVELERRLAMPRGTEVGS